MSEDQIQWLRDNLSLEIKEEEHYTYSGGDGSMYTSYKQVDLILDGEVISSISFK